MTVDRTDHPDVESLDAYADGERRDLAVDRHVHECPDCAEAVVALRRVREDLARLTTVTMPDDVAGRIRAALAADQEQPRRTQPHEHPSHGRARHAAAPEGTPARPLWSAGGSASGSGAGSGPVGPVGPPRRRGGSGPGGRLGRSWRPQRVGSPREWLVAAACLAVVVAIGVVAVDGASTTTDVATSSRAAPEAATEAAPEAAADSAADGRLYATEQPSVPEPAAPTPAVQQESPVTAGAVPTTVSASNEVLMVSEFTDHASEIMAAPTILRASIVLASGTFDFAGAADIPDEAWVTLTSSAAALCYHGLVAANGGGVLAVDQVRYSGVPALFVVLSAPGSPASVVVAVVDAACAVDSDASSPLTTATVARS